MRNLKLQYSKQTATGVPGVKFLLIDPNASRNSDHHRIYLVTENKLFAYSDGGGSAEELAEAPEIVGAEYLALDNDICLATKNEVLCVNTQTRVLSEGIYCDDGLRRMSWSPDQEVVAFVTRLGSVVVMTCTYDPIAEHPLAAQCDGAGQFVNVGWGRKETQFHGSEGKGAAKQKSGFQPPANVAELPQNIELSWRADGAYFAVSFVSADVGRMFKVFDKEGALAYTSEPSNNLEPPIAWRPSGTWIALPQLLPNKSTVALFEKNGLRHREIVLPFCLKSEPIVSFSWSPDSDILAVQTLNSVSESENLYLYTIGNYHWYLKQVLSFAGTDPLAFYTWDCRIGEEKTLHVLLQSGKYFVYRWHFAIDKYERSGVVAVIDGSKLLLSDFSKSVVPPPMCSLELQVTAADDGVATYLNACAFIGSSDANELQLCAYDAAQQLHLFKASLNAPLQFEKVATLHADAASAKDDPLPPAALGNLFWLNERELVAATSVAANTTIHAISFDIEGGIYKMQNTLLPLDGGGTVNALCAGSAELEQVFVQTLAGRVQQLSLLHGGDNSLKAEPRLHVQLAQPADQLQWYESRDLDGTTSEAALISLRANRCLYLDAQRIGEDVTSFCLAGNYLAFTKLTALYFLRLADRRIVDERKIERGGKLVTTIANAARIVLQMPRGNLEAICPRVLSLEIVGALLERRRYCDAMDMLRKQRINLNIICDHNLCAFVENLDVFLAEIKNPNWLNLFLSDLQNEDFTQTMYASNYTSGAQLYPEGFKVDQKIAYLCEKICERMEQEGGSGDAAARFRLPIITAYVKIGKLEKALELIWQQKKQESPAAAVAAASTKGGSSSAEDALKYLLYLVDVNQLYNVALGTYDFGLVLFVAQKSQKDPREFLPFLNELSAFELNYRRFKIDEHLKRYDRALQNIAQSRSPEMFEEALSFIKRHSLYASALKCYAPQQQPDAYGRICLAFGDHLRAEGKLENASIMYERGGNLAQALLSAKHVLDWQRALALARKDEAMTEADVASVALSMVASLQENGRHEEAFQLSKTYGNNFSKALQCLTKGKLFLSAIFESRMHKDVNELTVETITPALMSYRGLLESNLLADQELFVSYKQRLLAIREKKAKLVAQGGAAGDGNDFDVDVDECDLLSDTTSLHSSRYTGSSRGTGKTFRSSKNRRKHERKLLSLKPGNAFEDIALIDALHNLVMRLASQQAHIRDTCKALLEFSADEAAAAIQQRYKQLLALVQESLDEIWIAEMMTAQQFLTGPNIDYTQLQNEQRYAMINPQKRFKPQLTIIDWEHEILR